MSIPTTAFYTPKRNKLNGGNSASLNNNHRGEDRRFGTPANKRYHNDQFSTNYMYNNNFSKKRSPIKKTPYKNDQFHKNNKRKYNNGENRQKDIRDFQNKKSRSSSEENRKYKNSFSSNSSPTNSIRSNNSEDNQSSNRNPFSINNFNNDSQPLFIDKSSYNNNPITIEEVRSEDKENSINKKDHHSQNNKFVTLNRPRFSKSDIYSDRFNKQTDYRLQSNYSDRTLREDDRSSYENYTSKIDSLFPVPLRNLGNTCYMNAIVQALFNLPTLTAEIRDSMDRAILKNSELPFTMTKSIMELFKEYSKLRKSPSVNDEELERRLCTFKNNVSLNHVEFKSSGQHDAVEFLDAVINSVDDEYNKIKKIIPKCVNPIDKVFKIIYGEQSMCESCGTRSKTIQTAQHCLILSLPEEKFIKDDLNLQDLLNNYFKTEKRESKCEKCDSKERTTRMKVIKSPRVLILQLGRYTAANDKRHEQINVPQNISLPKVLKKVKKTENVNNNNSKELINTITTTTITTTTNNSQSTANDNQQTSTSCNLQSSTNVNLQSSTNDNLQSSASDNLQPLTSKISESDLVDNKFELNGVICHHGSCVAGGHYVSYVFDRLNDQWYQCDDENINPVNFEKVQEGSKSSGYCFFYLNKDKKFL